MADEEKSPVFQTVIIFVHQTALGFLIEIDHDIPTENDLKLIVKRKGVHQVETLEFDGVPDSGLQTVIPVPVLLPLLEIFPKHGLGNGLELT